MWFKAKKPDAEAELSAKTSLLRSRGAEKDAEALDDVLDTLASVVQMLGQHAFDIPECDAQDFAEQCQKWSRHILTGTASPATVENTGQEMPFRVPLNNRDWKGLYQFLYRHRREEQQAIDQSATLLRTLFLNSLYRFRQLLEEDRRFDRTITKTLQELQATVTEQPPEAMQAQLQASLESAEKLFGDKHNNRKRQIREMRIQIEAAREALLDMRREGKDDPLTGTHDRRSFDKAISRFTDYSAFVGEDLALMVISLDNLKTVKYVMGQLACEAMLRTAGEALFRAFPRKEDFISRYSEDIFAVILPSTDRDTAIRLAERCNEHFRELDLPWNDEFIDCTVSIGVANYRSSESIESCLARVSRALNQARQSGNDTYVYAESNRMMSSDAKALQTTSTSATKALQTTTQNTKDQNTPDTQDTKDA
ncbi:GGDEF domain-containing protein [Rhabdochromatium marinum]|uniref:GGDEF domain-containing protein n=1 Tax=Rhabdochromatium marinum TaxID=48729 RepID=UPI001906190C|nr:GGDEF domain-containing protein [Rhabdochromatium marinum]